MLCKFISITGTCISPETDFPSTYVFFEDGNCSTQYSLNIGSFSFCGRPRAEPYVKEENILKREACVIDYSCIHHVNGVNILAQSFQVNRYTLV